MRYPRMTWALICTSGLLASCNHSSTSDPRAPGVLEREIEKIVANANNEYSEITASTQASGDNLADVIERYCRDESKSLHDLFSLSRIGLDSAGVEGYAAALSRLLHAVGDSCFGNQLACEPEAVQNDVRNYLLFDLGCPDSVTPYTLKAAYPVTFPADTLVMEFDHSPHEIPVIDQAIVAYHHEKNGHDVEIVYTQVCHIPHPDEDLYVVRYDWQKNWWGDWTVVSVPYSGGLDWAATLDAGRSITDRYGQMLPNGQSIYSVRCLWLEGQHNPFVEIIGTTHMGHGSIYLYELDVQQHTLRLTLTTFVLDRHRDNTLIKNDGVLERSYRDLNRDGYTDVAFTGSGTYHGWEKEDLDSDSAPEATPIQHINLRKIFLWSPEAGHFITNRDEWEWFE